MSSHRRHDTGAGAEAAAREQPPDIATASLPPEVYLIGCSGDPASDSQPSAETMGFKAWNLLRMAELSLPVPAAFAQGKIVLGFSQVGAESEWRTANTE